MLSFPQIQLKFRVQCSSTFLFPGVSRTCSSSAELQKHITALKVLNFQESQDFFIGGKAVSRTADAYQDGSA